MSIIKNVAAFKNWYMFYAERYGFLGNEFELVHRSGIRLKLGPQTDDLKIVKSNLVTKHYFRDFVPIPRDSIVVDVGAHIGSFSVMAARRARKVLAFEPDPRNYQMLKKNTELNDLKNMSFFEMAVAGSSGYRDIYLFGDGSTGSHSLYQKDTGNGLVKKRVQTITIKDIIRKEGLSRIDFLKLDCEGAEHDIIKNMSLETAAKIAAIAMETHNVHLRSSVDLHSRLQELGFEVRAEEEGGYLYGRRILK